MEEFKLNILVLYHIGRLTNIRESLQKQIFFLKKYQKNHNVFYYDSFFNIPEYIKNFEWDAIILDVTLLRMRWIPESKRKIIENRLIFLTNHKALKLAFPQDEYDHNIILDNWLVKFKVDILYTVCHNHWEILFPTFVKIGIIKTAYTGYVEDIDLLFESKRLNLRNIDVGYRSKKLPAKFGEIGKLKWAIPDRFNEYCIVKKLNCNISTFSKDIILGQEWIDFIANSKYTLGTPSGSSIIDPVGEFDRLEKDYLINNPNANFEEIRDNCFPGIDGKYVLTAISPRLLESSMLRSCQILVNSDYGGVVEPWIHYIPLNVDFSNIEEVFSAMGDLANSQKIADNCYDAIASNKKLHYKAHSQEIVDTIWNFLRNKKHTNNLQSSYIEVCNKFHNETEPKIKAYLKTLRENDFFKKNNLNTNLGIKIYKKMRKFRNKQLDQLF